MSNNTAIESFEDQVIRVLNQMVKNGEVVTKIVNGEIYYSKNCTNKEATKLTRSEIAKKAVLTRKLRAAAKQEKQEQATVQENKRTEAANKAWRTRSTQKVERTARIIANRQDVLKEFNKKLAATVKGFKKGKKNKNSFKGTKISLTNADFVK